MSTISNNYLDTNWQTPHSEYSIAKINDNPAIKQLTDRHNERKRLIILGSVFTIALVAAGIIALLCSQGNFTGIVLGSSLLGTSLFPSLLVISGPWTYKITSKKLAPFKKPLSFAEFYQKHITPTKYHYLSYDLAELITKLDEETFTHLACYIWSIETKDGEIINHPMGSDAQLQQAAQFVKLKNFQDWEAVFLKHELFAFRKHLLNRDSGEEQKDDLQSFIVEKPAEIQKENNEIIEENNDAEIIIVPNGESEEIPSTFIANNDFLGSIRDMAFKAFSYLNWRCLLLSCAQVNKTWHQITQQDCLWIPYFQQVFSEVPKSVFTKDSVINLFKSKLKERRSLPPVKRSFFS